MSDGSSYPDAPKINVRIGSAQKAILDEYFVYGQRKAVFKVIVDDLCELLQAHGEIVLWMILSGNLGLGYMNKEMKIDEARGRRIHPEGSESAGS